MLLLAKVPLFRAMAERLPVSRHMAEFVSAAKKKKKSPKHQTKCLLTNDLVRQCFAV